MKIQGSLSIIGDKSLSHRAVILCSLATGVSRIKNILLSGDTKATIQIFRQLGVEINETNNNEVEIHGVGLRGLKQPKDSLDAVNSGTTARLLIGLLSKQNFSTEFICDCGRWWFSIKRDRKRQQCHSCGEQVLPEL